MVKKSNGLMSKLTPLAPILIPATLVAVLSSGVTATAQNIRKYYPSYSQSRDFYSNKVDVAVDGEYYSIDISKENIDPKEGWLNSMYAISSSSLSGDYSLSKEKREERIERIVKAAFSLKKHNKVGYFTPELRYNFPVAGIKPKTFKKIKEYEEEFQNFIAQIAAETYEIDGPEPPMSTEGIEEQYVKPYEPISKPWEDGSTFLKEVGVSLADLFIQKEAIYKDKIDKQKRTIEEQREMFKRHKIFEYEQKILRDLDENIGKLSDLDLIRSIFYYDDFVENLPLPIWSKYLSCSPKWSVAVFAAYEQELYKRAMDFIDRQGFDFSFEELNALNNIYLFKIYEGFYGGEYINYASREKTIVIPRLKKIYDKIEKYQPDTYNTPPRTFYSPKDENKVREIKLANSNGLFKGLWARADKATENAFMPNIPLDNVLRRY